MCCDYLKLVKSRGFLKLLLNNLLFFFSTNFFKRILASSAIICLLSVPIAYGILGIKKGRVLLVGLNGSHDCV